MFLSFVWQFSLTSESNPRVGVWSKLSVVRAVRKGKEEGRGSVRRGAVCLSVGYSPRRRRCQLWKVRGGGRPSSEGRPTRPAVRLRVVWHMSIGLEFLNNDPIRNPIVSRFMGQQRPTNWNRRCCCADTAATVENCGNCSRVQRVRITEWMLQQNFQGHHIEEGGGRENVGAREESLQLFLFK